MTRARGVGRGGRRTSKRDGVEVKWLRHLKTDVPKVLGLLGELAKENIEESARGELKTGKGRPLPPITQSYAGRKALRGASGTPDLTFSGRLWAGFKILKKLVKDNGMHEVWIGFTLATADQIKKWRRLKKQGRDPLGQTAARLKKHGKEIVRRGALKEVPGPPTRTRTVKGKKVGGKATTTFGDIG